MTTITPAGPDPTLGPDSHRHHALAELPAREVRADIQGLRALAVLLVLGFHLWPSYLVGGFVGVDVFFAISGFLITAHLLRSPPRHPIDFAQFWARRLRRLLPASLLVIAVTIIGGAILLPVTQLATLGRDALSAALYVENWTLALTSANYLGADSAPSALQHYWSLGVEEQFYLLWPFVIAAVASIAIRAKFNLARAAVVGLSLFVAVSLATSVIWTFIEPASAYFATPTRLWELAAGGLVAAAVTLPGRPMGARLRNVLAWLGVLLIVVSSFLLTASMPFPGYLALFPVGGACLVLAANAPSAGISPTRLLALRPIQLVGDTSYAIYLWHFPLIVLAGAAIGSELTIAPKVAIVSATLALAQLTRVFVEDPVRRSAWLRKPVIRTFLLAAAATVAIVLLAVVPSLRVAAVVADEQRAQAQSLVANRGCLGAQALANDKCDIHGQGVLPSPARALEDIADAYADKCFNEAPFGGSVTCEYGNIDNPEFRIALVGNSHAAQWLPALQELAGTLNFSVTTFVGSGCPPTGARVLIDAPLSSAGCHNWGQRVLAETIAGKYDLVVTSVASNSDIVGVAPADKYQPQVEGYRQILEGWAKAGQPVLVIRDTPIPGFNIPDCVAAHSEDVEFCDGPRTQWEQPDPMISAVNAVDSPIVMSIDLNHLLCGVDQCYAVVGGVLVYFDNMHVGATYIKSMAPYLSDSISEMLVGTRTSLAP